MTIESDIREWALQRPAWQQEVLVALSKGQSYAGADIAQLADRVLQPDSGAKSVVAQDLVLGAVEAKQVRLVKICNLEGVNALASGQALEFASDGLTLIYGNNGSGKSGYARLIKSLVSTRHTSKVLPNVFVSNAPTPSAEVAYEVDGAPASEKYPVSEAIEDLLRVRFYDEQCGDVYLNQASTITYRPSALSLMDGLVDVCDRVRTEIQQRIAANQAEQLALDLSPGTRAATFFATLGAETTDAEIDLATQLPTTADEDLGNASREVSRLEATSPEKEKTNLRLSSASVKRLADHLTTQADALSDARVAAIRILQKDAAEKRLAAQLAATNTFDDEPLEGVGSQTWRTLWNAARTYATTEVDPEHDFPDANEGALCVLCQQPLSDAAKDRFARFHRYMTDTTERDANAAERAYMQALDGLGQLAFSTPQTTGDLAVVHRYDRDLEEASRARLEALETHRDQLLAYFGGERSDAPTLSTSACSTVLSQVAKSLRERAAATDTDGFHTELTAARKKRDELRAAHALASAATQLKSEVARQKALVALRAGKAATDTSSITRKASELTSMYATKQVVDYFTRETERMKLRRVTLENRGGKKGKVIQMPALIDAKHSEASAPAVLSEGEQTVLGLAGFFTEARFDGSKSALVFDDPVTSLDHVRRDKVAERLVTFASERQVIVFTHDVAFVAELLAAAGKANHAITCHSIERRGDTPGYCTTGFPWKAQNTKQRLGTIQREIQRLRKDRESIDYDEYEKRVSEIGGELSETWERAVSSEIVNQVYDRTSSHVRPSMVKVLARFTPDDNAEFQAGYSLTSIWARRHDKAEETNYVPPEPDEIEAAYATLKEWHKRVTSYQHG